MQLEFLHSGIRYGWCESALTELLYLSQSEFGFICELMHQEDGTPFIRSHIISNVAWTDELREFHDQNRERGLDFFNFNSLWGAAITSGEPVIANDPDTDPRRGGYPKAEGHPPLQSFLGLPIKGVAGRVVGVMGLANRRGGYQAAVAEFLEPFVSTYGLLIEKARQDRREQALIAELDRLSHQDPLTGVANRRAFDEVLEREWNRCKRKRRPISLILFDIDFFKAYNDHHGHIKGDECLKRVARALNAWANRSGDFFARYGGEEFTFLLSGEPAEKAIELARICRTSVAHLLIPHGHSSVAPNITVSAGVATRVPDMKQAPAALVEQADQLLYQAKNRGRNQIAHS
ncbi:MAG: hypothetical protein B0D96_08595 [Candidatus Sedimenticola endophacoides]|nr:MAG: hypothetical protein B0D94_10395 [Candidatus Sedimenticola endophacoides]OQX34739.1 MAG: hypothetical protein B0D96_08595 [Candidatus Sedimenticola endophacoides]OQX44798.1 MAG: hypothetical protein B0D88_01690 [Candidatus Sedimenticola endophacoides]